MVAVVPAEDAFGGAVTYAYVTVDAAALPGMVFRPVWAPTFEADEGVYRDPACSRVAGMAKLVAPRALDQGWSRRGDHKFDVRPKHEDVVFSGLSGD